MLEQFTDKAWTIKSENRDFIEWHKGRTRYVIWALEIDDASWLNALQQARSYLQDYLLIGEHRAPHITLFACGFMDEQQRQASQLQIQSLQHAGLRPFALGLVGLDSFLSATYFSVEDSSAMLQKLRAVLGSKMDDDRLEPYCPHLTVGLYRDSFSTTMLTKKIKQFEMPASAEIKINKISLMSYATDNIFSALHTEFQLVL